MNNFHEQIENDIWKNTFYCKQFSLKRFSCFPGGAIASEDITGNKQNKLRIVKSIDLFRRSGM